ncbi:DUF4160 domain-containing protein [Parablastomonas sp. CN1-191]|uniref:DUF4160 domain-containing protein n=1 Tax=Parablastomonas sp. CN1-191 TaxID=3400908 RepID=UPI003BF8F536
MPTVLRIGPYRFYFFSNEGDEPPHIHVDRDDATAKLWLDPASLAASRGFRPKEIGAILGIVAEHRDAMLEAWHDHFGTGN